MTNHDEIVRISEYGFETKRDWILRNYPDLQPTEECYKPDRCDNLPQRGIAKRCGACHSPGYWWDNGGCPAKDIRRRQLRAEIGYEALKERISGNN